MEMKMLEDARLRVSLTPTALPSICFYTFLNTDQRYAIRQPKKNVERKR